MANGEPRILLVTATMGWIATQLAAAIPYWLRSFRLTWLPAEDLKPLAYARNWAVEQLLAGAYTHLWWLDADTVPPQHALQALLDADVPVIAALIHQLKIDTDRVAKPVPMLMRRDSAGDFRICTKGRGVEQVDRAGFACTLFRRAVFEVIKAPWFEERPLGDIRGTDYIFAEKMETQGMPLFGHFGVVCKQRVEGYI